MIRERAAPEMRGTHRFRRVLSRHSVERALVDFDAAAGDDAKLAEWARQYGEPLIRAALGQ